MGRSPREIARQCSWGASSEGQADTVTEKKEAVHGPRDLKSWVQLALRGSRRSGCGQEPGPGWWLRMLLDAVFPPCRERALHTGAEGERGRREGETRPS